MIPVQFLQANVTVAKDQPEYQPLPACYRDSPDMPGSVEVVTCWELDPAEAVQLQNTGKIWLRIMTFGAPLQPVMLQTEDPFKVKS